LRELRERGIGQQRHVAQQLVTAVRFRRVKRIGRVADVLGAVEHAERQSGQEIPGRQVPGHRPQLKSSFA